MKKFCKSIIFCCVVFWACVTFCACAPNQAKKDPKFENYPFIPNQILGEVNEVVTPEMFGAVGDGITDDTDAVQSCLAKYSDNKSVCVLSKTYACSSKYFKDQNNLLQGLRVFPNTYIYLSGKLVSNPKDGHGLCIQLFEYNGDNSNFKNKNITITGGGTVDGLGYDENTAKYNSLLRMGHGENIKIENITFKNATRFHGIEITACKDVVIDNCKFEGFFAHNLCDKKNEKNHSAVGPHEFVQIEELDSGGSGGMTPYDSTIIPQDITVSNCTFSSGSGEFYKAIGDHGARKNSYKNIKIKNNVFKNSTQNTVYDAKVNPSNNCIVGFYTSVDGLEICENTFENCNANAICASGNVSITNNLFKNILLGGIEVLFDSTITILGNKFENIATFNIQNGDNYFSYIKIGNSQSAIKTNVTIQNNIFQNDSSMSLKILECFEFAKSTYVYTGNTKIGKFAKL